MRALIFAALAALALTSDAGARDPQSGLPTGQRAGRIPPIRQMEAQHCKAGQQLCGKVCVPRAKTCKK
jgi:hypothetical protein